MEKIRQLKKLLALMKQFLENSQTILKFNTLTGVSLNLLFIAKKSQ